MSGSAEVTAAECSCLTDATRECKFPKTRDRFLIHVLHTGPHHSVYYGSEADKQHAHLLRLLFTPSLVWAEFYCPLPPSPRAPAWLPNRRYKGRQQTAYFKSIGPLVNIRDV